MGYQKNHPQNRQNRKKKKKTSLPLLLSCKELHHKRASCKAPRGGHVPSKPTSLRRNPGVSPASPVSCCSHLRVESGRLGMFSFWAILRPFVVLLEYMGLYFFIIHFWVLKKWRVGLKLRDSQKSSLGRLKPHPSRRSLLEDGLQLGASGPRSSEEAR